MGVSERIYTCDGCGADLTYRRNSVDYRTALISEPMPGRGDGVTDMMVYPEFAAPLYFCNRRLCLAKWAANYAARHGATGHG